MKSRRQIKNPIFAGIFICVIIALVVTLAGFWFLRYRIMLPDAGIYEENTKYRYHYAFIVENPKDVYWENVYEAAKEQGKKQNIYVERLGDNLPEEYSVEEYMQIAMAQKVDGILLQSTSKEVGEYMNEAAGQGIDVVTMLHDNYSGTRCAFVGANGTDIGKTLAKLIQKELTEEKKRICILLDEQGEVNDNQLIVDRIRKELDGGKEEIYTKTLQRGDVFGAEEAIRDMILDSKNCPDILVCLSVTDTLYAYQSVVDYNKVGSPVIIGNSETEEVKKAVEKQVLSSAIRIDSEQIGKKAVMALMEYQSQGVVNEYQTVPCQTVGGGK